MIYIINVETINLCNMTMVLDFGADLNVRECSVEESDRLVDLGLNADITTRELINQIVLRGGNVCLFITSIRSSRII